MVYTSSKKPFIFARTLATMADVIDPHGVKSGARCGYVRVRYRYTKKILLKTDIGARGATFQICDIYVSVECKPRGLAKNF